tara:strand:+ start:482 stop:751 length:270 start_codon:yes stop_codon:yes gene_type:complete
METIVMTRTELLKNPNTKTTYILESEEIENITTEQYVRISGDDTLKYFRRMGGSETAVKGYTCRGYLTTILTSTSPDKETKIIRTFKFN